MIFLQGPVRGSHYVTTVVGLSFVNPLPHSSLKHNLTFSDIKKYIMKRPWCTS